MELQRKSNDWFNSASKPFGRGPIGWPVGFMPWLSIWKGGQLPKLPMRLKSTDPRSEGLFVAAPLAARWDGRNPGRAQARSPFGVVRTPASSTCRHFGQRPRGVRVYIGGLDSPDGGAGHWGRIFDPLPSGSCVTHPSRTPLFRPASQENPGQSGQDASIQMDSLSLPRH